MPEKKESARATVLLSLATVVIAAYALAFGLQTLIYFEARHWTVATPFLTQVPQPLPSTVASAPQEKTLSFYGYQFAAPWKGIRREQPGNARSQINFAAGPILVFFNPEGEKNIVESIRRGDPQVYQRYQTVFGQNLFPDDYALYRAVYGATPASLSPFMSSAKAVRISTLLQWKMAFGNNNASAIYTLHAGRSRGLQFGDPSHNPAIVVRLFDPSDREMRLLFTSKSAQPGTFSQADINCVIDSIEPVSAAIK
ncbi:MAG TPA: hypothetical protein VNF02_06435 [Candidatus Limnocylindrales bacterium]|nr:hypothetical protein [Candidatus Limnocylindrales bacterium]